MNRRQIENYQVLTQVANFAGRNVGLFPKNSAAAELLTALESGVKTMSEEAGTIVSAETAIRVGSGTRKAARAKLKTILSRANQFAAALNTDVVHLPAKWGDRAIIDSGRALTGDAESMRKEFAQHGLSLDTVSAAVEALEQAMLNCSNARAMRTAANERWAAALEETLRVATRYDVLAAGALEDNPGAMAEYVVACTPPRSPGRKAPAEAPAAPPASSAAAA